MKIFYRQLIILRIVETRGKFEQNKWNKFFKLTISQLSFDSIIAKWTPLLDSSWWMDTRIRNFILLRVYPALQKDRTLLKLTNSRIEPRGGAGLMIDEVNFALGCAGLFPSVGQWTERVGVGFAVLDCGGYRCHIRGCGCFSRILPCRAARQVTAKKRSDRLLDALDTTR